MTTQAPQTVYFWHGNLSIAKPVGVDVVEYIRARTLADAMKLPEVAALVAATRRQVENVERWLETGTPADADESKAIYDAMVNTLAPFIAAKDAANG